MKIDDSKPRLTRQQIADPHADVPHLDKLAEAGAVDLRDNVVVESLGNGYATARPVDQSKVHGKQ